MAKFQESRVVAGSRERARAGCLEAARALSLRIDQTTDDLLLLKEKFSLLSLSWPATLTVHLQDEGAGTRVSAEASNFGFGPIQNRAMQGRVQTFLDAAEAALARGRFDDLAVDGE